MKSILSLVSILVLSATAGLSTAVWADGPASLAVITPATSQPTVQATPAAKKKKAKKKSATKLVWVCPMGDYSGPQTKDGKCPKCGMNLVKEEVPVDSTPTASTGSGGM